MHPSKSEKVGLMNGSTRGGSRWPGWFTPMKLQKELFLDTTLARVGALVDVLDSLRIKDPQQVKVWL